MADSFWRPADGAGADGGRGGDEPRDPFSWDLPDPDPADVWTPPDAPLPPPTPLPLRQHWWREGLEAALRDLEAARRRLRQETQDLRAEMEAGPPHGGPAPTGYPDGMAARLDAPPGALPPRANDPDAFFPPPPSAPSPPPPPPPPRATPWPHASALPGTLPGATPQATTAAHGPGAPGGGPYACVFCTDGVARPEALRIVRHDMRLVTVNGAPYRHETRHHLPCCLVCWQRLCFAQYLVQTGALSDWPGGTRHDFKALMPPVADDIGHGDGDDAEGEGSGR